MESLSRSFHGSLISGISLLNVFWSTPHPKPGPQPGASKAAGFLLLFPTKSTNILSAESQVCLSPFSLPFPESSYSPTPISLAAGLLVFSANPKLINFHFSSTEEEGGGRQGKPEGLGAAWAGPRLEGHRLPLFSHQVVTVVQDQFLNCLWSIFNISKWIFLTIFSGFLFAFCRRELLASSCHQKFQ